MKRILVRLNDIKRRLVTLNDRAKNDLMDLSRSGKRKIWFKLYADKIAISSLMLLVALVNALSAGISLTLTGGNWSIGTVPSGNTSQTSGSQWTVTGAPDGKEDVDIKVSNAGSWSPDSAGNAGSTNKFALRINNSGGTVITGSDTRLVSSLDVNGTYSFGLWFKTPPLGSEGGSHTLTVTLTAANFVQWCQGGYNYQGYCWRPSDHWGHHGHDWWRCDWICSARYGKGCADGNYKYRHDSHVNCNVVQHFYGGHNCYSGYQSWCHLSASFCGRNNWIISYSGSNGSHEGCGHGPGTSAWSMRVCSCAY